MARVLKPQQVFTLEHKGIKVPLYLNRNDNTFFAEYEGETYENPALEPLKRSMKEIVEKGLNYTWFPVIQVNESYTEHTIHIHLERYYVAIKPDGVAIYCPWDTPEDMRNVRASGFWYGDKAKGFNLPHHHGEHGGVRIKDTNHYYGYDEPRWAQLNNLKKSIEDVRQNIHNALLQNMNIPHEIKVGF